MLLLLLVAVTGAAADRGDDSYFQDVVDKSQHLPHLKDSLNAKPEASGSEDVATQPGASSLVQQGSYVLHSSGHFQHSQHGRHAHRHRGAGRLEPEQRLDADADKWNQGPAASESSLEKNYDYHEPRSEVAPTEEDRPVSWGEIDKARLPHSSSKLLELQGLSSPLSSPGISLEKTHLHRVPATEVTYSLEDRPAPREQTEAARLPHSMTSNLFQTGGSPQLESAEELHQYPELEASTEPKRPMTMADIENARQPNNMKAFGPIPSNLVESGDGIYRVDEGNTQEYSQEELQEASEEASEEGTKDVTKLQDSSAQMLDAAKVREGNDQMRSDQKEHLQDEQADKRDAGEYDQKAHENHRQEGAEMSVLGAVVRKVEDARRSAEEQAHKTADHVKMYQEAVDSLQPALNNMRAEAKSLKANMMKVLKYDEDERSKTFKALVEGSKSKDGVLQENL